MHRTRTPLRIWFWAIYLVVHDKRGRSALNLQQILGISYYKAWTMLHKIRKAMEDRDNEYALAGLVEIDDTYFGAPDPARKGRGTSKSRVIVSLSVTGDGKPLFVKMNVVDEINKESISATVQSNVEPNSTVKTDGLNAYKVVEEYDYKHDQHIFRDELEVNKWPHILISNVKAFILGTYHGVPRKHLQVYLDEFSYRFNRRFWPGQLFLRLLRACIAAKPFTYAELTR